MPGAIIPNEKEPVYNLRRRRCHLPKIKTESIVVFYSVLIFFLLFHCNLGYVFLSLIE